MLKKHLKDGGLKPEEANPPLHQRYCFTIYSYKIFYKINTRFTFSASAFSCSVLAFFQSLKNLQKFSQSGQLASLIPEKLHDEKIST